MEKNKFLNLKPILLKEVDEPFNDNDFIYEIKFDGIRCLIYVEKNKVIIKSRNNVILNDKYPELLEIKNITKETCIFDGEIVLFNEGVPNFSKVLERLRLKNKNKIEKLQYESPVTFVCFDILYKNKDLTNLSLIDRKKILNKFSDTLEFVKSKYYNDGIKLFNLIKKENLEGIVAKKKNSIYVYGKRVSDWLKIKNIKDDEFFVCGYQLTKNDNILNLILGEKINNKFKYVGKVIVSKKNNLINKILKTKEIKKYLDNYDEDNSVFIKPEIELTICYLEKTKNNLLRHPCIKD